MALAEWRSIESTRPSVISIVKNCSVGPLVVVAVALRCRSLAGAAVRGVKHPGHERLPVRGPDELPDDDVGQQRRDVCQGEVEGELGCDVRLDAGRSICGKAKDIRAGLRVVHVGVGVEAAEETERVRTQVSTGRRVILAKAVIGESGVRVGELAREAKRAEGGVAPDRVWLAALVELGGPDELAALVEAGSRDDRRRTRGGSSM